MLVIDIWPIMSLRWHQSGHHNISAMNFLTIYSLYIYICFFFHFFFTYKPFLTALSHTLYSVWVVPRPRPLPGFKSCTCCPHLQRFWHIFRWNRSNDKMQANQMIWLWHLSFIISFETNCLNWNIDDEDKGPLIFDSEFMLQKYCQLLSRPMYVCSPELKPWLCFHSSRNIP